MATLRDVLLYQAKRENSDCPDDDDYPSWVCSDCARKAGAKWPKDHLATFHNGTCDVCGEKAGVTQPRDWGYPRLKRRKEDG